MSIIVLVFYCWEWLTNQDWSQGWKCHPNQDQDRGSNPVNTLAYVTYHGTVSYGDGTLTRFLADRRNWTCHWDKALVYDFQWSLCTSLSSFCGQSTTFSYCIVWKVQAVTANRWWCWSTAFTILQQNWAFLNSLSRWLRILLWLDFLWD